MLTPVPLLHNNSQPHSTPHTNPQTFPAVPYRGELDWTLENRHLVISEPHPTDYHLTPEEKLFILMTMCLCIAAPSALVFLVLLIKDTLRKRQNKRKKNKIKSPSRLRDRSAQTLNNINNNFV